jgi:ABC-type multidrug transport system fused ATPase/permease subunit
VVERGSHAELLARAGLYARLWLKQASEAGADPVGLATV